MCFGGGNLFGSAGGIAGGLAGTLLFPEFAIPAAIAGSALGTFGGDLIGGEKPLQALEGGAIAGATAGVGAGLSSAVGGISGISNAVSGLGDTIGSTLGFGSSVPSTATGTIGGDFTAGSELPSSPFLPGSSSAVAGGPTTSGPIASATVDAAPLSGSSASPGLPFTPTNGNAVATLAQTGGPSPLTPTTGAAGAGSGSSTIPGTAPNAGAGGGGSGTGGSSVNYFGDQTNPDLPGAGLTSGDPGAAGGGGVGGGGAGSGNWLTRLFGTSGNDSSLGGKLLGYLGDNPQALLGGAILGGEALFAPSTIPGAAPLRGEAAAFDQLGQVGANALTKGQLPTGAQAVLDQMRTAGQARIRSNYASLGLSGSTSESQALAQNDQQVEAQKYQIINQLVTQGVAALGQESNINTQLMNAEIAKDKALQDSIARFAASLAGGGLKSAASA